ncbi:MAG: hypothetical protein IJ583_03290 [Firmicutes bacterium]|nr:hypothetical protein [Bacillota bacterium]
MKCPQQIRNAINRRVRSAMAWNESDIIISVWCKDNGIELDSADCFGGVEGIINPKDSAERILKAIKNKKEQEHKNI